MVHKSKKLVNLGCGRNSHDSWLNFDIVSLGENVIAHDLSKGIPLGNDEVDVVYHSHVIEHFSNTEAAQFIAECFRVLKPGGHIRVVAPDLEQIAREYLEQLDQAVSGDKIAESNYDWMMIELLDQIVRDKRGGGMENFLYQENLPNEEFVVKRVGFLGKQMRENYLKNKTNSAQPEVRTKKKVRSKYFSLPYYFKAFGKVFFRAEYNKFKEQAELMEMARLWTSGEMHKWMYDRFSLSRLLINGGFRDVTAVSATDSRIEDWGDYNLDVVNGQIRKPDSVFVEGTKW